MAKFPAELRYTKDHEWAKTEGNRIRVGITSHAVEQLGDVTLVDVMPAGTKLAANARFGDIESVKAVSELFAPVAGTIVEVNKLLHEAPEKVNESPYEAAWMVVIEPDKMSDVEALLDVGAYDAHVASSK